MIESEGKKHSERQNDPHAHIVRGEGSVNSHGLLETAEK